MGKLSQVVCSYMANKLISLEDKHLVIQRLAEGLSTRQAIEGTAIASNNTAARLAKDESHTIAQRRAEYVEQINRQTTKGQVDRAVVLAHMIVADKYVRKPVPSYKHAAGWTEYGDELTAVPDWDARLKAIKYIDQMAGLMPMQGSRINVVQQMKNQT